MKHKPSLALLPLSSICLGAASLSAYAGEETTAKAVIPIEQTAPTNSVVYRISAGAMYRNFGGIGFRTSGNSQRSSFFDDNQNAAANAGSVDVPADRTYDDGYVRKDAGTATDGQTWNWGYDKASQVQGDTLTYHSNQGYDASTSKDGWHAGQEAWSPYLAFEVLVPVGKGFSVGPHFSISYASISDSRSGQQTVNGRQSSLQDTFVLDGVTPPPAPYANTFDGPGPLINNIPSSRQIVQSGGVAYNRIGNSLDMDLTTVTVGMVGDYKIDRFHLSAVAGATISYSEVSAEQNETLYSQAGGKTSTVDKYHSKTSDSDFLLGFSAQAGGSYDISDHVSLGVFGRYDWVDDVNGGVGPSTYSVDLTGWSGGVVATYFY